VKLSQSNETVVPIGTVGKDVGVGVGIGVGAVGAAVGIEVGSVGAVVGTAEGDVHDNGLLLQLEELHVYTSL
jgi:hypothetical protein